MSDELLPVAVNDAPRLSMRQRLARLGTKAQEPNVLDPLFQAIRASHPRANLALVERAYLTAEQHHSGQKRKSGDPYITHPLAVATILAELGAAEETICAGLLHDTVEDTDYTLEQVTADFGPTVALLVDGVTKLDKVTYGPSAKAETLRKMIVNMSQDIRVLVIKLADRLHNMRTLHFLRPDKQNRIAAETLEVYAPLAHRLGMNTIKWELEDQAFSTMQPKLYDEIVHLVAQRAPSRERFLKQVTEMIDGDLHRAGIRATVTGRPKHYYSIYQKMIVRGRSFEDIYDLVALRIIVDSIQDCYGALGVLHSRWNPLPGRFKDYIAMPKYNMYQSLHTTVRGPEGTPVEFQIRTWDMHRRADYGVAAHWKYKEGKGDRSDPNELNWVRALNQWQRETEDPEEFLDDLLFSISVDEVIVYTPKGDMLTLPQGATPVDFAYQVHTEVGHRCIGARVNGRLVPLESKLQTGDRVEILTSKAEGAGPSRDWLEFVASPRARAKIRQYFSRERRDEAIESGKEALARQMRRMDMPMQRLLTIEHLTEVAAYFRVADVNGLYKAVGEGSVSPQAVCQRLVEIAGGPEEVAEETSEDSVVLRRPRTSPSATETGVMVHGDKGVWVKLARCCTPVPGDDIIGFITRASGVSVHRRDCSNAQDLLEHGAERIVEVSWAPTSASSFLVTVQILALDRNGLLSDVTRSISEQHISITSASVNTHRDRTARITMSFETPDPTHLDHVMNAIRRVPGVYDVGRVRA